MKNYEIVNYLNDYLRIDEISDYASHGLQVEGKTEVKKIVTGVSVSVELFEKAKDAEADMIIVHHGLIWNKENPIIKGGYKKRIKILFFLLDLIYNIYSFERNGRIYDLVNNCN